MSWFSTFITSSIGRKLVMSLTGLFLVVFLAVHLVGNLQLLVDDGGEAFNLYAKFMTTNPLIKTTSYLLYATFLLHAIQGILLWRKNLAARSDRYAVKSKETTSFASRNMGWLGVVILVFLLIHLYQFWLQMKMGNIPLVEYGGEEVKDLYTIVAAAFSNPAYVGFYVFSMIVVGYHLVHGFQSAFQTIGWNHPKYMPIIKNVGIAYAVLVPLAFAVIPIYFFLTQV